MNRILLFIPFFYFLKTRLNTKAAILFHGYAEYLLGLLLLIYSGLGPSDALWLFVLGYAAFISLYEIGYIVNDFVSIRFEQNPRKRLGSNEFSTSIVYGWIATRIVSFILVAYYLHRLNSAQWWVFYGMLFVSFLLHNVLRKKEYKIFTFMALAFMRFYAPVFPFLETQVLIHSLSGILLFYVFFRTLTYIDSKGLLVIPNRASFSFKLYYYSILLPVSVATVVLSAENLTLWINLYFILFWGSLYIAYKSGAISESSIKTES